MCTTSAARSPQGHRLPHQLAPALDLRIGDADRQPVTRQLAEALALGYLTMQEYEGRLDRALQAQRATDLRELTKDLPQHWPTQRTGYRPAARQGAATRGVRIHLGLYLAAALGALAVWLMVALVSGTWYFWPAWPILGGAIGLTSRVVSVHLCGRRAVSSPSLSPAH